MQSHDNSIGCAVKGPSHPGGEKPKRFLWMVLVSLGLVVPAMTGWAALAIFYSNLPSAILRTALAVLFPLLTVFSFLYFSNRRRTLAGFISVFFVIVAWWTSIPASHSRDWEQDVAVLPYAEIQDNLVTVYNIRNFHYRTETDFDARYYDRTYNLHKLDSVDLIAVYWMGDAIAHIMITFGFEQQDFLTFSIEIRKEKGEIYSSIKGFFKQYELIYVAGDERDLIRVRTDYRSPQEDVYIFRVGVSPDTARKLFLEYVRQINKMKTTPVWYNTLTTNCTTNIVMHIRAFSDGVRYNWKIFLSGYTPLYAYELGILDTSLPFPTLKKLSYVNHRAHEIGNDPVFSLKIRDGLPRPAQ